MFPGDSEIDQLFKIFRITGTPNNTTWPEVEILPEYKQTFPMWKGQDVFSTNNNLSPCVKELFANGLVMDPSM